MPSRPSRSRQVVRAFVVKESGLLEPPPPPAVTISKHMLCPFNNAFCSHCTLATKSKHPMRSEAGCRSGSGLDRGKGSSGVGDEVCRSRESLCQRGGRRQHQRKKTRRTTEKELGRHELTGTSRQKQAEGRTELLRIDSRSVIVLWLLLWFGPYARAMA